MLVEGEGKCWWRGEGQMLMEGGGGRGNVGEGGGCWWRGRGNVGGGVLFASLYPVLGPSRTTFYSVIHMSIQHGIIN